MSDDASNLLPKREREKKAPPFDHHGCIIVMGQWRGPRYPLFDAYTSSMNASDSLFKDERIRCHGCKRLGDVDWEVEKERGKQALA